MIKILQINSTIVINSGVMKVLMNYYSHLDKSKICFDFLYFTELKENAISYEQEIKSYGGSVFYIPNFTDFKKFNNKLKKHLLEFNYDIVHIHDPIICRFIYKTLRECGVKNIIVHSHATKWSDKVINGLRNYFVCRGLNNYIDYRFACSLAAGQFLYGNNSFYVMNNAIDKKRYAFNNDDRETIRKKYGIQDSIIFGNVGNFVNQKNQLFLIDVFNEIQKRETKSVLMIIGDGSLRTAIEDRISKYGLEKKVLLLGKKSDVEKYYNAMDCFIMPSLYEGLPMVGVESQCSGLPVVFSDTITKEVAFEKSIYLSLRENKQIWAEKAIQLAMQNVNFDRFSAVEELEMLNFDIEKECKKLENKYAEIIQGGKN